MLFRAHTYFQDIYFTPSLSFQWLLHAYTNIRTKFPLLACRISSHKHTNRPRETARRCEAFSPVMLFAGQVYGVEMACLFFLAWGSNAGHWGIFAGQPQWWRSAAERAFFQDDTFDMPRSSSVWSLSVIMYPIICPSADVTEFPYKLGFYVLIFIEPVK